MKKRMINYNFAEGEVESVLAAVKAIVEKCKFLQLLSSKDRIRMLKQGPKRTGFVKDSNMVVEGYPEIVSAADVATYHEVVKVYDGLQQLSIAFAGATELFNHTAVAAGSDAMAFCLHLYRLAKVHADKPGMNDLIDRLSEHFKRTPHSKEGGTTAEVR